MGNNGCEFILARVYFTDASSDDEPLVRKVKTAKAKDKFRKRANGEEETVKQGDSLCQHASGTECSSDACVVDVTCALAHDNEMSRSGITFRVRVIV